MLIKILFVLFILCTAALLAVGIAFGLRVRRHLKQEHSKSGVPQDADSQVTPPSDENKA